MLTKNSPTNKKRVNGSRGVLVKIKHLSEFEFKVNTIHFLARSFHFKTWKEENCEKWKTVQEPDYQRYLKKLYECQEAYLLKYMAVPIVRYFEACLQ